MTRSPSRSRPKLLPLAALAAWAALTVLAAAPARAEQPREGDKLEFTFGVNRSLSSPFDGVLITSKSAPVLGVNYERGRWFADTQRGLGYYLVKEKQRSLGLALNWQPGRKQSEDARYAGLGDVSGAAEARLYGQWQPVAELLTLYADAGQAVGGSKGLLYNLGATVGFPIAGQLNGFVDAYVTGGSGKYVRAYYGVDAAQSASSGYAQSRPGGGLFLSGASVGLSWRVSPATEIVANLGRTHYRGAVGDGPVVQQRGQGMGALVVNYRY